MFKEFDTYDVTKLLINNNNSLREEFKNQSDSDFCSVIDLLDYDGKFTDFYTLNTLFYNFRNVEIYKNKETNIYKQYEILEGGYIFE